MKNSISRATWGILFVLLGVVLAGKAFNVIDFNIFFRGWWTLFIIIPSALSLFERNKRTTSIIGLGIGILLLLAAQGFFQWYMFGKILVPFIFIVIGISLLFRGNHDAKHLNYGENHNNSSYDEENNYTEDAYNENTYNENTSHDNSFGESNNNQSNYNQSANNQSANNQGTNGSRNYGSNNGSNNGRNGSNNGSNYGSNNGSNYGNNSGSNYGSNNGSNYESNNQNNSDHNGYSHFTGVLSGRNVQFVNEVFTGAVITSILGNVQLDLRNAIFNGNAVVETLCILGGIDIYVPSNVKVMVNCTPILGGVDNKAVNPINASGEMYTLFITGTCILGGIEVK